MSQGLFEAPNIRAAESEAMGNVNVVAYPSSVSQSAHSEPRYQSSTDTISTISLPPTSSEWKSVTSPFYPAPEVHGSNTRLPYGSYYYAQSSDILLKESLSLDPESIPVKRSPAGIVDRYNSNSVIKCSICGMDIRGGCSFRRHVREVHCGIKPLSVAHLACYFVLTLLQHLQDLWQDSLEEKRSPSSP